MIDERELNGRTDALYDRITRLETRVSELERRMPPADEQALRDDNCEWVCEIAGCGKLAQWEGWIGRGVIRKIGVCGEHRPLLRGAQADALHRSEAPR